MSLPFTRYVPLSMSNLSVATRPDGVFRSTVGRDAEVPRNVRVSGMNEYTAPEIVIHLADWCIAARKVEHEIADQVATERWSDGRSELRIGARLLQMSADGSG